MSCHNEQPVALHTPRRAAWAATTTSTLALNVIEQVACGVPGELLKVFANHPGYPVGLFTTGAISQAASYWNRSAPRVLSALLGQLTFSAVAVGAPELALGRGPGRHESAPRLTATSFEPSAS